MKFQILDGPSPRGRFVQSTVDLKPGALILSEEPLASTLDASNITSHCSWCLRAIDTAALRRCSGCRSTFYCSVHCQRAEWKAQHKVECLFLNNLHDKPKITMLRLLFRVISKDQEALSDLLSHQAQTSASVLSNYAELSLILAKYAPKTIKVPSTMAMIELLSKIAVNGITLKDDRLDNCGVALFAQTSMFNHSCEPNCTLVFQGHRVHVRALKEIPSGSELTLNYVDLLWSRRRRRQALQEQFHFECKCARCLRHPFLDPNAAYRCPNAKCSGLFSIPIDVMDALELDVTTKKQASQNLNMECPQCHVVALGMDQTVREVLRVQQDLLKWQRSLDDGAFMSELESKRIQIMATVQRTYSRLLDIVSEEHEIVIEVQDVLVKMYCAHALWEEAETVMKTQLKTYDLVWGASPVLAVRWLMMARILKWMDRWSDALVFTKKALGVLDLFGVQPLLHHIQAEYQELTQSIRACSR